MSIWAAAAIATVFFMCLYKSEVGILFEFWSSKYKLEYNSRDFWHKQKSDSPIILKDFAERLNFKIAPHIEFQIITVIGKGRENQIRILISKVH